MISTCDGVHKPWWRITHGGDYYSLEQNLKREREERPQGGYNLVDIDILDQGDYLEYGPECEIEPVSL